MPDSFQLELPEPDPDEPPLELEGPGHAPAAPVEASTGAYRFFTRERADAKVSYDIRQPQNDLLPADVSPARDPDELWQESVDRQSKEELRFSLAELFFVTALLAVILTVGRFVRLPVLAGLLGLLVLIGLGVISNQQRSRTAFVVWITLVTGYVFIAIAAAWTAGD